MKKYLPISLSILQFALCFVPSWYLVVNFPQLSFNTMCIGIITSFKEMISFDITQTRFIVALIPSLLMLICMLISIFNIVKKNLHLPLISAILYLLSYIPYFVLYKNDTYTTAYPFIGFYIGIVLFVVIFILDLKYIINLISKLKNRQRKPTNKERIAQLEKELQELKNKSN